MRVLLVDDNPDVRMTLKSSLSKEAFIVDTAEDGKNGSFMARTNEYDVIILDNIMPGKDGLTVCKEIRRIGKTVPIILLSVLTEINQKVALLEAGADDYLTKPYSHRELVARLRALTKRSPLCKDEKLAAGDITLDSYSTKVMKGTHELYLTRKEFSLLEFLLRNKGRVASRSELFEHVWNMDSDPLSKTVETHILNLRKKIERKGERIIQNVHGRGYIIKF